MGNGSGERRKMMKNNPMRFIKCFVVCGLCLLTATCGLPFNLDIDIGDYKNQLKAWNSQNMLDYQFTIKYRNTPGQRRGAVVNVRNGIPESSDPPEWLTDWKISTIPEIYSFIKEEEDGVRYRHKTSGSRYSFKVSYNTEYHYPNKIETSEIPFPSGGVNGTWTITLTPLEENGQETGSGGE
jgi:hypothetical protein